MKAKLIFESIDDIIYNEQEEDNDTGVEDREDDDYLEDDEDDESGNKDVSLFNTNDFIEGEEDDIYIKDELETSLDNQLKVPEYARTPVSFKVKGESEIISAIPMAKLRDNSFLMKIGNKYKKFKLENIVEE